LALDFSLFPKIDDDEVGYREDHGDQKDRAEKGDFETNFHLDAPYQFRHTPI
jgi:hypothetical protein